MHRRRTYALALAASALVTGMGAATPTPAPTLTPTPTPTPTATQSDGTLQILTYRGYAEYGGVSPKVNWVGSFEKETGCRIAKLDTVQTAEEMDAQVDKRPYDLVSAGPALAGRLIAEKKVQPIDPAKVSGYEDIDERFRDMMTVSDKVYGVPYLWGYHQFIYDPAKVKGNLEEAFSSERTALKDSPLTIADAALAAGEGEEPFELSNDQLDRAMALLEGVKERTYWTSPVDLVKGFATGSLDYAQATPYYRLLLQKAGMPVKGLNTRETTGWVDSWMLGAGVPDTTCAYRWLNWVTASNAQRDAAAWVGLAPANDKACKGRAKAICEVYEVGKAKRLDRVVFAVRPPGGCQAEDGECTDYVTWSQRWQELVK
ncbi:putative spermidine/putrescine transport system substrate-binding protein [Nonomuraea polychroma]|uniref:Putative spermidine/putrescine transport system substrate-binding protein n=1 Tax=Nonomuraea polychroma TaxID=46176 RepID=A0A438LWJ0_9ACTN|nr:extracellular solute-binding protein [Nonomuraea polychroma]RVX37831.1 putative spermidine/putrescine transport system substrate-binding protein [Nonomuraea polychroma]